MKHYRSILAAVFALSVFTASALGQKLTADEIISKHLASIGTPEARGAMKNYFAVGASSFASKFPNKKTGGKALIASEGTDLLMLASFMSQEYPFEKIGHFRGSPTLPWVTSGTRSPLGAFIADHPTMLTHGLFGGAMSTNWAFRRAEKPAGRVETGGSKKIDGKRAVSLDYYVGGGSEFTIKLYFDAETYQHLRTEYRHVIPPQQDPFGTLGRQTGVKIELVENFSDFKTIDGLTLPHAYTIKYMTDSNSGTFEYDWGFNITSYYFNQKLEPGFFTFDTPAEKKS